MTLQGTFNVHRWGRIEEAVITPVDKDRLYAYPDKTVVDMKFKDGFVHCVTEAVARELIVNNK